MKYITILLFVLQIIPPGCSQAPQDRPHVENPEFDEELTRILRFDVPLIGVKELENIQNEVFIFDTRQREEYLVSHIPNAEYLGYEDFDPENLTPVSRDASIVLYCSVGYRSEKIGEKLQQMGYTQVRNLYGSIFEWVNQGNPVVTPAGDTTHEVHTYNKQWSRWVDDQGVEKVW